MFYMTNRNTLLALIDYNWTRKIIKATNKHMAHCLHNSIKSVDVLKYNIAYNWINNDAAAWKSTLSNYII